MKTLKLFALQYPTVAGAIYSLLVYVIGISLILPVAVLRISALVLIISLIFVPPAFTLSLTNSWAWVILPIISLIVLFVVNARSKSRLVKFVYALLAFYIILWPILGYSLLGQSSTLLDNSLSERFEF